MYYFVYHVSLAIKGHPKVVHLKHHNSLDSLYISNYREDNIGL
jgi:hypothetical protein